MEGVPISGTLDYKDFTNRVQKESKTVGINTEHEAWRSYITSGLPSNVTGAWLGCIKSLVLSAYVTDITKEGATLHFFFSPEGDAKLPVKGKLDTDSIQKVGLSELEQPMNGKTERELLLRRAKSNAPGRLAIHVGSRSVSVLVPLVAPTPAFPTQSIADKIREQGKFHICFVRKLAEIRKDTCYAVQYIPGGGERTWTCS